MCVHDDIRSGKEFFVVSRRWGRRGRRRIRALFHKGRQTMDHLISVNFFDVLQRATMRVSSSSLLTLRIDEAIFP